MIPTALQRVHIGDRLMRENEQNIFTDIYIIITYNAALSRRIKRSTLPVYCSAM